MIEVKELYKNFEINGQELNVLCNLNVSINSGELVSIVGPSGSGKSTFLKILAGLEPASAGEILFNGHTHIQELQKKNFSFLNQSPSLFPWLTVLENVMLPCKIGINDTDIEILQDNSRKLLARLGLGEFISVYPKHLSGGMYARVALARALINAPSLLLLDEPFNQLDELTRESLYSWLVEIREENHATCLLVTHSLEEAIILSDKVLVMPMNQDSNTHFYSVPLSKKDRQRDSLKYFQSVQELRQIVVEMQLNEVLI